MSKPPLVDGRLDDGAWQGVTPTDEFTQQSPFDGQMMGMPHKGVGLTGYDGLNKQFVGCWADNLTPAMINFTGSLDQTGSILTLFGKMDEPTTGERGKTVRFQTTIIDDDTHKMTIDEVCIEAGVSTLPRI